MKQQVIAKFEVPGMTDRHYDRVIADLNALGAEPVAARRVHVAGPSTDGWSVTDVWESAADLDRFLQLLLPVLERHGVTPTAPTVLPLHALSI